MLELVEIAGCLVASMAPLWAVCKVWEIRSKRKVA